MAKGKAKKIIVTKEEIDTLTTALAEVLADF